MVDWGGGGMVDWGSMVGGGSMVDWGGFVGWGGVIGSRLWVLSLARVGHLGNVSAVGISHVVVDSLDPAVGEVDGVGAGGGVAVAGLVGAESSLAVVVGHGVDVGVDGGLV